VTACPVVRRATPAALRGVAGRPTRASACETMVLDCQAVGTTSAENPANKANSQPLSSFSTKKTRSSTARSKASADAANAGGAKGPYLWRAFEDGEVTVIGESLPDKIRNLQRKTVIYTENGKGGMGGSVALLAARWPAPALLPSGSAVGLRTLEPL
jgi:hypothetical protein